MKIYPAIDIKGGRVVRLVEGDRLRETAYTRDPVAQANAFAAGGATWIHAVDMDRAFHTGGDNTPWLRRIAAVPGIKLQVGGNLRTTSWVREAKAAGAARIVLGTETALDAGGFVDLVREVGAPHCALAVDVRAGAVALRDRPGPVAATVEALVEHALSNGVETIVYRDIDRDGLAQGADVAGAARVVALGADVILAGGIAALDELVAARRAGLAGVILGRALYERRFTLDEAMACSA